MEPLENSLADPNWSEKSPSRLAGISIGLEHDLRALASELIAAAGELLQL